MKGFLTGYIQFVLVLELVYHLSSEEYMAFVRDFLESFLSCLDSIHLKKLNVVLKRTSLSLHQDWASYQYLTTLNPMRKGLIRGLPVLIALVALVALIITFFIPK